MLDLYVDYIIFTVDKVGSLAQGVPNILKGLPITKLSIIFKINCKIKMKLKSSVPQLHWLHF